MTEFRRMPEPNYDCSRKKLIDQYKQAYTDVLAAVVELTEIGEFDGPYQKQASTLRKIDSFLPS